MASSLRDNRVTHAGSRPEAGTTGAIRVDDSGSRPRICILTETYHPVVGGGEKQAQALAGGLAAHGLPAMVITRRSSIDLPKYDTVDGIPVYRIGFTGSGQAQRWLLLLASFGALLRWRHAYDVVFVAGFKALGISGVLVGRLLGKPCVLKADSNGEMSGAFFATGLRSLGMTPSSLPFRTFLLLRNGILRHADAFVAITSGISSELHQAGIGPDRICEISNSVDTTRFTPACPERKQALRRKLRMPDTPFIVVYVGRLVRYKGLPLLLEVAADIRRDRRDVGFVLVGSGGLDLSNCEDALREYVVRHGLAECVSFAGEVANVDEFLQAADVFAFPSQDDAFPLALVEAMACGLPPVTTPVGGIPEIVTHEENGLLFKPGDREQLRRSLCLLIENPGVARALGAAAARTVQQRYSTVAVSNRYRDLFLQLMATSR
jgi:glycosyltransferase involved in cell wall biosynthesis